MDHLGLERADYRLRERIIVGISGATDGGFAAGLGKALCVADAHVLRAVIRMTDKAATGGGAALVQGRLQGVEGVIMGRKKHTAEEIVAKLRR